MPRGWSRRQIRHRRTRNSDRGAEGVDRGAADWHVTSVAINTQRKILAGIVTLAGAALVVDRVILDGGVTNPASSHAAAPASGETPVTQAVVAPARPESAQATLGHRLSEARERLISEVEASRPPLDAFQPPASMQTASNAGGTREAARATASPLVKEPDLSSVIPGVAAVINGKTVRVGEISDSGIKLISAAKDHVVLEHDGRRFEVHLAKPLRRGG